MRPRHVYVHVPFCRRRCSYCDFSIAVRPVVPAAEYLDGLNKELDLRYPAGERWEADTLYFGGGTPSRLGASGVARMVDVLRGRLELADGAEVTLEANPDDIDADSLRVWREVGINRLSIGVQSFDDRVLQWMHRTHSSAQTLAAIDLARAAGFEDFSLDLIFSLPVELGRSWERDLDLATRLEPRHLSLYGLTVEPSTPIAKWRDRGQTVEAPEENYESDFLTSHRVLAASGFRHYEVSNYARSNGLSRHNSSYWRGVPYAGLGPSAHEFDGQVRRWNESSYAGWLERTSNAVDPMSGSETLTDENRVAEYVYLSLRTDEGMDLRAEEWTRADRWIGAGWAVRTGDRLRLTAEGWLRLDSIAADLTHARSHY